MKTLADGKEVSARSYYYLLDFNDRDGWKIMIERTGKHKLHDLTLPEFIGLFVEASKKELKWLKELL